MSATIPGRLKLTATIKARVNGGDPARNQIRSRDRVRDFAEVYTHKREVDAMLDLVPEMFPGDTDPQNTDCKFFEPACGSGNFLEEILRRKLAFVTVRRHGVGECYEHRILRCLASIYGIDINVENVSEARGRIRALINSHVGNDLNTQAVSPAFFSAVEVILSTNLTRADTLSDAASIEFVEYHPGRDGTFSREWSYIDAAANTLDLFSLVVGRRDEAPIHYSRLADHPVPVLAANGSAPKPRNLDALP